MAKGSVEASKTLSVIKTTDGSKYLHHDPSTPLRKNQILSYFNVSYASCRNGQQFPEPDDPYLYDYEDDLTIKQKLLNRLTYLEPRGLNLSFSTIKCKTPAVCMDMNTLDFVKIATPAMIQKALMNSVKFRVSDQELTKQLILQHEWDLYRKKTLNYY